MATGSFVTQNYSRSQSEVPRDLHTSTTEDPQQTGVSVDACPIGKQLIAAKTKKKNLTEKRVPLTMESSVQLNEEFLQSRSKIVDEGRSYRPVLIETESKQFSVESSCDHLTLLQSLL
ncbi:hypothetical protein TNCV_4238551 [Trichonephila clavipes]|nr:hypothetical protein TNCV_4238551 [Trichonephila clavipes]